MPRNMPFRYTDASIPGCKTLSSDSPKRPSFNPEEPRKSIFPMSNLPTEVVVEIFHSICQPPSPSNYGAPEDKVHASSQLADYTPPLFLGRICREWRTIAWSAPPLWTFIYLIWSAHKTPILLELLKEWLERTRQLTISVVIRKASGSGWEEPPTEISLFQAIVRESPRWDAIDISVPSHCFDIMDSTRGRVPRLRTASIHFCNPPREANFLSEVPQLHDLTLQRCLLPLATQYLLLTRLKVVAIHSTDLFEILRQTPNLKFCHLERIIGFWWYWTPSTKAIIHLEHLETLVIRHCFIKQILPSISVESTLRSLSIIESPYDTLDLNPVAEFLDRCKCPLQALDLEANAIEALPLYFLLAQSAPLTLRTLRIRSQSDIVFGEIIDEILQPFPSRSNSVVCPWLSTIILHRQSGHNSPVLPNLQYLDLHIGNGPPLPVINMLKHRRRYDCLKRGPSDSPEESIGPGYSRTSAVRPPKECGTEALAELDQDMPSKVDYHSISLEINTNTARRANGGW